MRLEPGSHHPIAIAPQRGGVRIVAAGVVIADSRRALVLIEAGYPPVIYVPRQDARMDCLIRSQRRTHCPYKGEASYFTIRAGDETLVDAVWSYEAPYPAMAAIARHLAFYRNKVTIEIVD